MADELSLSLFKNRNLGDVTFVFDRKEVKAHKAVLTDRCDYFKLFFDENKSNVINIDGTPIEPFHQLINYCYSQKIDLTHFPYSGKKHLYDLAIKYNYRSLIDLVKIELDKRPQVPLREKSLNEWYGNCPDEEIREWVKNNQLTIINYEDCHKYSKDLVVLIMDTFCELSNKETDKQKFETPLEKLLMWLFRWRNSAIRKQEDVQSLFANIRLPLVLKDRALSDKRLKKKLFEAVHWFYQMTNVDAAGWTCNEVLELVYVARDNKFIPLLDALVNTVVTQYLEPTALEKIHYLTTRLESSKLQQIMAHYIKVHSMIILTSAEYINYSASLVAFILENVRGQVLDVTLNNQLLISLWSWKTSKSEEEVKVVFIQIQWEDLSLQQLAGVIRILIPTTCLPDISSPLPPLEPRGAKRKHSDNYQHRRRGCPLKYCRFLLRAPKV